MSIRKEIEHDPRHALIEKMDDVRVGMLGVEGSSQHMQPMTHFTDWDTNTLYFITSSDTDLVRAVGLGGRAHYCVVGKDQDFHACLAGTLEQVEDQAKLDELWSPVAGAWFEKGREDPKVTLLRLTLADASVWGSTESSLRFGFEIARANMDEDHLPDVGVHKTFRFAA